MRAGSPTFMALGTAVVLAVAFWPPKSLATAGETQDDLETEPQAITEARRPESCEDEAGGGMLSISRGKNVICLQTPDFVRGRVASGDRQTNGC